MAVTIIAIFITITISAETYIKNLVTHDYSSRTICSAEAAAGAELGSVMVQTLVWKCVNPNPEFAVWPRVSHFEWPVSGASDHHECRKGI